MNKDLKTCLAQTELLGHACMVGEYSVLLTWFSRVAVSHWQVEVLKRTEFGPQLLAGATRRELHDAMLYLERVLDQE